MSLQSFIVSVKVKQTRKHCKTQNLRVCLIRLMGVDHRQTKREGQRGGRQTGGLGATVGGRDGAEQTAKECDGSRNERVNPQRCHFARLWERSHVTAASGSQIRVGRPYLLSSRFG